MHPSHRSVSRRARIGSTIGIILCSSLVLWYAYTYFDSKKGSGLPTMRITRSSLVQETSVSGVVEPTDDAQLAFEKSGVVKEITVRVGDAVTPGMVLASLDSSDEEAKVLEAKAKLAQAKAELTQSLDGPTREELALKEQALENAQTVEKETYVSLVDVIRNTDATIADAIPTKLAALFRESSGRYVLSFSSCDQVKQASVEQQRYAFDTTFGSFQKKSSAISSLSQKESIEASFEEAKVVTAFAVSFLEEVGSLLSLSCNNQDATATSYRTTVSTSRTSAVALLSTISSERIALTQAKNAVLEATRSVEATRAGSNPNTIAAKRALVLQAEASLQGAESSLRKTYLRAPFAGIVRSVSFTKGESVSPNEDAISLISSNGFHVATKIREIDVAKVRVGQRATIYLDAYGKGTAFSGTVTRVDPSPTKEGSVPLYRALISFVDKSDLVRDGMTAEVHIVTGVKENIIALPPLFIALTDDASGVVYRVRQSNGATTTEEIQVQTGIRGTNGFVEVIGDLQPGDILEAPVLIKQSAQKGTSNVGGVGPAQ